VLNLVNFVIRSGLMPRDKMVSLFSKSWEQGYYKLMILVFFHTDNNRQTGKN